VAGQTVTSSATALSATAKPGTRIIVDMFGRKLTIPSPVNRVLCTGRWRPNWST
jgi:ABC-type Fe3+-hydroxamate transport system substrate-binding protein